VWVFSTGNEIGEFMTEKRVKGKQGFASMDPEKQRAIASRGGKLAHKLGRAHKWNSQEASEAGRRGGLMTHRRKRQ
jgi:general stress protein YciG